MGLPCPWHLPSVVPAWAVELVRASGRSKAQVARDLGINREALCLWVEQAAIDAGQRDGLTTVEQAELARLRRAVGVLKEAREILKEAAAFFARERATR
jgi:transposase